MSKFKCEKVNAYGSICPAIKNSNMKRGLS